MSCDFWWEENEEGATIKGEAEKRAEALVVMEKNPYGSERSHQPGNGAKSREEEAQEDERDAFEASMVHLPYSPDEPTTEDGTAIEQLAAPMITEMMFLLAVVPICGIILVYLRRRNFRISMDLGTGNSSVSLLMRDGNVAYQYS
eukprot:768635-Hanusia_phi.AAC.4